MVVHGRQVLAGLSYMNPTTHIGQRWYRIVSVVDYSGDSGNDANSNWVEVGDGIPIQHLS